MAYAAMTSDTIRRDGQEERRLAQEAREHAQKIPDNYRKLLFSEDDTEKVKEHYTNPSYITPHAPSANAAIERAPAPVQTARPAAQPQPSAPAHIYADPVTAAQARTAQRLADYIPYESNKNKRVLFDNITSKSSAIKDLKKAERETDKSIKSALSALKEAEGKASGEAETRPYKRASATISGYERAITVATRTAISIIKLGVQQDRMVIGKLAAASPNNESALLEQMAWFEGADDFATQEDIPAEEVNAEDIQSDPDVVVNIEVEPEECNG